MRYPIYPDKTKTGLAALKPLTDEFFAEPERWQPECFSVSEFHENYWETCTIAGAIVAHSDRNWDVRLTPKPRRVWIGDQSFPEPLQHIEDGDSCYLADIVYGEVKNIKFNQKMNTHILALDLGFLFDAKGSAKHCLDAYRKARRTE